MKIASSLLSSSLSSLFS